MAPENAYQVALLEESDPHRWGGTYVEGDEALVIQYSNQTEEAARERLAAVGVKDHIALKEARFSLAEMESVMAVIRESGLWPKTIVGIAPLKRAQSISVEAVNPDARLVTTLTALTKGVGIPILIEEVSAAPQGASRYYDTVPYYGGNAISLATSSGFARGCSTAFNMTNSGDGYQYALTAAHCYSDYDGPHTPIVQVRRSNGSGEDTGSGVGTVWSVSQDSNGEVYGRKGDIAVYRYTPVAGYSQTNMGAGLVFTGDGNSTTATSVKNVGSLSEGWQGSTARTSGAAGYWSPGGTNGSISPDWVSKTDHTVYYQNTAQTFRGLTVIEDASECVDPGDSGGAVYLTSTTGATALGIISGNNGLGGGTTNCRNYYTPLSLVWSGFGVVRTS